MSTLPKDVDAVDTVAGPVGALVTGVVHERAAPWALTGELNRGAAASRPRVKTAAVAGRAITVGNRRDNIIVTSKTLLTR
jgi:hypothetical protein